MNIIPWLIFACLLTTCCLSEAGSSEMFNYGIQYGDEVSPRDDVLKSAIRVFGDHFTLVRIAPNDSIEFYDDNLTRIITVKGFTLNAEVQSHYQFFFRLVNETSRPQDTEFADELVHEHFGERCANFRSSLLLIMTAANTSGQASDELQVAIISDGNMTFVMFQYKVISFPADFEVTILGPNTVHISPELPDERDEFLFSGNTGVQGRVMFRIDLCADCYILPRSSGICYIDNCICFNGFTGHMCSNATGSACRLSISNLNDYCIDEVYQLPGPCNPSPCLNNGTCTTDGLAFNCSCVDGYAGPTCETNIDECATDPCVHGTCVDEVGRYQCTCEAGYTGANCEQDIDECVCWPCVYGRCTNTPGSFECLCPPLFGGPFCGRQLDNICDSSPCHNGTCVLASADSYICRCPSGFTGANCETNIDDCLSRPCVRGSCVDLVDDYRCDCEEGFAGKNCDLFNGTCGASTCKNGTCEQFEDGQRCNCDPGYTGRYCDAIVDYCASSPCVHGDCVNDGRGGFTCEKCPGYTGSLCETEIDYCLSSPCTVGLGTCRRVLGGYICDCIDDVSGLNCEEDHRPPVGTFGLWGSWSQCSRTCGKGVQTRYRQCLRAPCLQVNYEVQLCQTVTCPERILDKEHVVLVLTGKSLTEVLQIEKRLSQHIISEINKYCSHFPRECCSFAPEVGSLNTFKQVLTAEHVSIVHGYTQKNSIGLNQIGFVVRAPFSIWYMACALNQQHGKNRQYRQVYGSNGPPDSNQLRHLDVPNKEIYLDRHVLYYVVQERLPIINNEEDLCCLFLESLPVVVHPSNSEGNKTVYIVIPIAAIVVILLSVLIALAARRYQSSSVAGTEPVSQPEDQASTGHRYGRRPVTIRSDDRQRFLPNSYLPCPIAYNGTKTYPLTSADNASPVKK